jgi:hypothetical protein
MFWDLSTAIYASLQGGEISGASDLSCVKFKNVCSSVSMAPYALMMMVHKSKFTCIYRHTMKK